MSKNIYSWILLWRVLWLLWEKWPKCPSWKKRASSPKSTDEKQCDSSRTGFPWNYGKIEWLLAADQARLEGCGHASETTLRLRSNVYLTSVIGQAKPGPLGGLGKARTSANCILLLKFSGNHGLFPWQLFSYNCKESFHCKAALSFFFRFVTVYLQFQLTSNGMSLLRQFGTGNYDPKLQQ